MTRWGWRPYPHWHSVEITCDAIWLCKTRVRSPFATLFKARHLPPLLQVLASMATSPTSASTAGAASVSGLALVVVVLLLLDAASVSHAQLQVGFYAGKCKGTDVEAVIRGIVQARFKKDPSILPALLRMQFHDCFVRVRTSYSQE